MKTEIRITGIIDEEEGKLELSKNGLNVPHLLMVITALTKTLFNDLDEEDHELMRGFLKDIAENPQDELKTQFEAIRIARLKISLKSIEKLLEDDKDDKLN